MQPKFESFSEALQFHLAESHAKVSDIARKSGVNADKMYKLKQGETREPSASDAALIAQYFHMTYEEFMGDFPPKDELLLRALINEAGPDIRAQIIGQLKGQLALVQAGKSALTDQ